MSHSGQNSIKQRYERKYLIVTSVAVVITKFLFGMCDCMVDSDIGTGDFLLVLEILYTCGHA